jgi:sugar/nucleoside kinase (ribokinase family)
MSGIERNHRSAKIVDLLCIGNAMVDVFAEVPPGFCKQFGLNDPVQHIGPETVAAILTVLEEKCPSGNSSAPIIMSGGGASNTAKIAARLGVNAAFAGAIGGAGGHDRFGTIFEEELKRSGVFLHLFRKQSLTGVFISLCPYAKEKAASSISRRIIAAAPSAALELDGKDLDEFLFARSRLLMIEGFLLGRINLVRRILDMAEKYNLTLAMDIGTADNAAEYAGLIRSWFGRYPLILFLNEKEAEAFAGVLNSTSSRESMFTALSLENSGGSVSIAVKLAERGAAVFSGGTVYHAKTDPVEAAESTGAGDAFAAGFLAAWLRGEGPQQCGLAGNAAAALVLRSPGTGGGAFPYNST